MVSHMNLNHARLPISPHPQKILKYKIYWVKQIFNKHVERALTKRVVMSLTSSRNVLLYKNHRHFYSQRYCEATHLRNLLKHYTVFLIFSQVFYKYILFFFIKCIIKFGAACNGGFYRRNRQRYRRINYFA